MTSWHNYVRPGMDGYRLCYLHGKSIAPDVGNVQLKKENNAGKLKIK
jgi:hypothetical protein